MSRICSRGSTIRISRGSVLGARISRGSIDNGAPRISRGSCQAFPAAPPLHSPSFFGTHPAAAWGHIAPPGAEAPPAAPPHCGAAAAAAGAPVQTFPPSAASSSSPHVPPRLLLGVCPQGVLATGCGGGWPPLRRFASQRSVPLLTEAFHTGGVGLAWGTASAFGAPGSGEFGTSHWVS
uniref:Uncharacterized protein n=1 Tax=Lutzomyia longipalpis TaxID=7200 RepID=A0A7G3B1B2_LUTLO